jgi:hypothetical protein
MGRAALLTDMTTNSQCDILHNRLADLMGKQVSGEDWNTFQAVP